MSRSTWTNWARNQRSEAKLVTPRDLPSLQQAVIQAATPAAGRRQPRIRVAGGSYSWSRLIPNPDTILRTSRLRRLLDFDPAGQTVTVESGMTIQQLDRLVRKRGFTLIMPTLFPQPTVGGAIAVGAHHTSRATGCFSDSVEELTIVDGRGAARTVRRGDPDFPAAQVSLGTLGVVYSAKLRLEPQFNVYRDLRRVPVREVIDGLLDLEAGTPFLELFWWPFQDTMWVYRMRRTDSPADRSSWASLLWERIDTALEWTLGGRALPWTAGHMPGLTPLISKAANRLANSAGVKVQRASDAFHFQKAYPRCWDMQLGVRLADAPRAWAEAIELVSRYAKAGLYPMNLALHGRFTGRSDAWLAPNHDRRTCYIEAVTVPATRGWKPFFQELEDRWLTFPEARPHWGKLFWRRSAVAARYPRMADFIAVRRRWDPDRVFLNDFLEREIGLA